MSESSLHKRTITLNGKNYNIFCEDEKAHYFAAASENYDYQLLTLINNTLPDDGICLDIGANIGFVTMMLHSRLLEGNGAIYSLEPARNNFKALKTMIQDNKMSNVTPLNMACSNQPGVVSFLENNRWGHLDENSDYKVLCISLDYLLKNKPVKKLDFIKIDVEGNEWNVLRGARETLKKFNPIIYMEFNSLCLLSHTEENPKKLLRWIFENFKYVSVISKKEKNFNVMLKRYFKGQENFILHRNILTEGAVSNLVITNNDKYAEIFCGK